MAPITPSPCAIVHYHEISLKRGNRPLFLRHLQQNISARDRRPRSRAARSALRAHHARSDRSPRPGGGARPAGAACAGIANIALAERTGEPDRRAQGRRRSAPSPGAPSARSASPRAAPSRRFRSRRSSSIARSAPTCSRSGPTCAWTSITPSSTCASRCCRARPSSTRSGSAGPGGLPVGSGGTVAALLSGGIDSPVAAWRMMKRGCRVVFVHFHSVPYLPDTSQRQGAAARRAAHPVAVRLAPVPRARSARSSARSSCRCRRPRGSRSTGASWCASPSALGAAMRRARARHRRQPGAGRLADAAQPRVHRRGGRRCRSCGRSSAWTRSRSPRRPQAIDTFEISIEPDADCCTLFVPAASGHAHEPRGGRGGRAAARRPGPRGDGRRRGGGGDLRLPGGGRGVSPARATIAVQGEARCRSERAASSASRASGRPPWARGSARAGARAPRPVLPARGRDRSRARAPARSRSSWPPITRTRSSTRCCCSRPFPGRSSRSPRRRSSATRSSGRSSGWPGRFPSTRRQDVGGGPAGNEGMFEAAAAAARPGRGDPDLPRGREPARAGADAAPHGRRAHAARPRRPRSRRRSA